MRPGVAVGNRAIPALAISAIEGGGRSESASGGRDAQEGLALFAEGGLAQHGGAAGFIVEQNRFNDGLHVAANAGAVVVEFLDDAIKVLATWMARNQTLNEL